MEPPPKPNTLLPLVLTVAVVGGLCAVLFLFNPERYGFYPRCPLYLLTGLQCPGCGGLRAIHQLTHGHIITAFRFNPLVVIFSPIVAWFCLRWLIQQIRGNRRPIPVLRPGWSIGMLLLLLLFGILRNIPWIQAKLSGS